MSSISNKKKRSLFACSYRYKGRERALTIPADNWADAEARLAAISTGWVDGELGGVINMPLPERTPKSILNRIGDCLRFALCSFGRR